MKTYLSLSALALVAALSGVSAQARADGSLQRLAFEGYGLPIDLAARPAGTAKAPAPAPSGQSRAEVRAELQRARRAGELDFAAAEVGADSLPQATPVYAADGAVKTAGAAR